MITKLNDFSQNLSVELFRKFSRRNSTFSISPVSDPFGVHGNLMCLMIVSGERVHLTFKVQFDSKVADYFLSAQLEGVALTAEMRMDFFKEYCNLVLGSLKSFFEQRGLRLGLGLPVAMRGIDNLFFENDYTESSICWAWKISEDTSGESIFCFLEGEIPLASLDDELFQESEDGLNGNISYL